MRFITEYIVWHYSKAIRELCNILLNFIWFFYNFFSIPLLLKTFFTPFKRLDEKAEGGLNISVWFEAFVVTNLMRLVGILLRTILIFLGALMILLTVLCGAIVLVTWILAPAFLLFLISFGVKLITLP